MTGYKGPGRRSTQRRVDDRSQRFSPAQDPVHGLDDRIEREPDPVSYRAQNRGNLAAQIAHDPSGAARVIYDLEAQRDLLLDALERIRCHGNVDDCDGDCLTGHARSARTLVDQMGSLLRDEQHAFATGPELLRRILEDDAWRHFVTKRGETITPASFEEFVTAKPLKGLGSSVDLVKRIAAADVVTLDLLDQAMQRPAGGSNVDNIHVDRPTGTSASRTLRQLRKDAPELHTDVLNGKLTPHAAAIKAGLRKPTATVPVDSPQAAMRALARRFTVEELRAAVEELA